MLDIERAVEYAQAKEAAGRYGQASLFDGSGEEEYPPFAVNRAEEYPRAEILRIEKELLGFYFSGHPMDEWRKIWERCCDADLAHPERANPDKTYTLVAMLKEFREILTKSGKKMAFGALEDPAGSIEIVVFADALERWREKFVVDSVLCLRGKIDLSRGKPSLKVEEFVDPASLREKSWNAVHLRLGMPSLARGGSLRPARRSFRRARILQRVFPCSDRSRRVSEPPMPRWRNRGCGGQGPCPNHLLLLRGGPGASAIGKPRRRGLEGLARRELGQPAPAEEGEVGAFDATERDDGRRHSRRFAPATSIEGELPT